MQTSSHTPGAARALGSLGPGSLIWSLVLSSCSAPTDDLAYVPSERDELRASLMPFRYNEGEPATDPSNRFSGNAFAVELGKKLFFDPSLSGPLIDGDNDGSGGTLGSMGEAGKVSCASCHVPEDQFVDTRSPHGQISLAAMWTPRRTPTLLDVAFAPLYNWDGRRDTLWGQALGVMESHIEFNSGRLFVATRMFESYREDYEATFGSLEFLEEEERFPRLPPEEAGCQQVIRLDGPEYFCRGKPGDGAEYDELTLEDQALVTEVFVNVGKAMAAYLERLRCGTSRFDDFLDGADEALTESELRGASVFLGKGGCAACHSGPLFTDGEFHNVGLAPATVAVAFTALNDRGAGEALPLLIEDPLNSRGDFSDGDREFSPEAVSPEMEGAFRTPGLRCLIGQPSFMHTGQYTTLRRVLEFFNEGGHFSGYPGQSEITALGLTDRELDDLEAFIGALEGEGPPTQLLEEP